MQTYPSAKGLYNKPFPYFDVLGPIFSKDVANRVDAEDLLDVVEAMDIEANVTETKYGEDGLSNFVEETQQISTNDNSGEEVERYASGSNFAKKR